MAELLCLLLAAIPALLVWRCNRCETALFACFGGSLVSDVVLFSCVVDGAHHHVSIWAQLWLSFGWIAAWMYWLLLVCLHCGYERVRDLLSERPLPL